MTILEVISLWMPQGTYNDAISALQDEYDNKSYWVNQWNADNSIATVSEKDQWIQDRDDALELRTQIINDGAANFTPTSFAIAQIDVKLNSLGNQLLSLAPASIQQQINTQMQFLEAKKMQLNAGAVDVIQVGELYAATGNVEILADNLIGASNGRIESKNEASISVINNSNSPIETNNIYIPDDPGGTIYYNEQIVRNTSDVTRLNRSNGAVGFGMISDPGNFEATVNIESTYDALAHANGLDIKSPEMLAGR